MQQLALSQLKSFKATVVCCSLCGTGSWLLSYTSVFHRSQSVGCTSLALPQLLVWQYQFHNFICLASRSAANQRRLLEASLVGLAFFSSYMHYYSLVEMFINLLSF